MKLQDFDFRIWDGKKYINNIKGGVYIHKINDHIKCLNRNQDCYNYEFELDDLDNSNLEIELFTGLYDKKGNKIYENDIVEYHENEALIIKYIKGTFYACQDYEKFMKKYECQDNKDTEKFWLEEAYKINNLRIDDNNFIARFEIIGNIHENAELLK